MDQKEMKKSTIVIAMIIILLIQIIARVYVGYKKEYFHIDEAYSYSLMNYDKINITDNEDFYGNWHSKDYYLDYLTINENEKWNWTPVYENQKNDVHPPLFYLLLRISAMFTIEDFTKWTGIILNIVIWVFSSILVYLIASKLFKDKKMALFTCLITGLTLGALETTVYIRMYELGNFFVLLITYLHMRIYEREDIKVKELIPIGISVLLGSFTHYYIVVYSAILFIILVVKFIKEKEYKNLVKYVLGFTIAGVISLLVFPHSLTHMFGGYRGQEAKGNLLNLQSLFTNLGIYVYVITKNLFGKLGIIAIILYIALYIKKRKENIAEDKIINLILIPTVLYFIIIAQISSYKELRYIMPIISTAMICAIYMFYSILKKYVNNKNAQIITAIMFIVIIISPAFTYTELDFTFTKMNHLAEKIEEKSNVPALYVFNENNNRFLDDITIFTKSEESYIMKYSELSIDNLQKVLNNKDTSKGIILVCNSGVETENVIEQINEVCNFENNEKIQWLNAGVVYYLY